MLERHIAGKQLVGRLAAQQTRVLLQAEVLRAGDSLLDQLAGWVREEL